MSLLPAQDMGPAAEAFRRKAGDWLAQHWSTEEATALKKKPFNDRGWDVEFSKAMGRDGWIGVGWPTEYGGQGRSPAEQLALISELTHRGVPYKAHIVSESIVAQALFLHGSHEQKNEWLPAIRKGERTFALGYSESEAGSDLAALRTRATREGDEWVVNGQKLWATYGDKAEYAWLAVRTDPEAKKHHGISILMVKLNSPGITIRPSIGMHGNTLTATFYDNVRVPAKNMVGAVNTGWNVIVDALAAERTMISGDNVAKLERALDRLTEYVKSAVVAGKPLKNDPLVRDRIGALAADLEIVRRFGIRTVQLIEHGRVPIYEAAMGKVFGSELQERTANFALDILGTGGLLSEDAHSAPLPEMEHLLRNCIMGMIGGGTNEIQRNIIALHGLDLPR